MLRFLSQFLHIYLVVCLSEKENMFSALESRERKEDNMSDLYDESESGMSGTETGESERFGSENMQESKPAEERESITYSWVSPKIKASEETAREEESRREPAASPYERLSYETEAPVNSKKKRSAKKKKTTGSGKKWVATVSTAVVFGLVAGLVFTGVSAVGRKVTEPEQNKIQIAAANEAAPEDSEDVKTAKAASDFAAGTVADVAAQCMPSLVTISTISVEEMQSFFGMPQQYEVEGAGTGVIVGQNDTELLIATNNHVVAGAKSLSVGFIDETAIEGAVKGYDSSTDLAVVAVKLEDIPGETMEQIRACEMGNSDELVLGEQVVAIGNALGYGQSVTSGYISAFNRELNLRDEAGGKFTSSGLIQTDASINSGNSGGALLNMRGELIGINEAKSSGGGSSASVDNIGFAIPISKAEPILQNLMTLTTRDKVDEDQACYIGITCADVSEEAAEMYQIPQGICLTGIMEGGPAEAAGLKKGDILIRFDGREVSTYNELTDILQYYSAGETVDVVVQRSDEGEYAERTIPVTLGAASEMPENYRSGGQQHPEDSEEIRP